MKKIIIANWKSYINLNQSITILKSIKKVNSLIIAPSIINLSYLTKYFPLIRFASQDISFISDSFGAYTGETPIALIKALNIKYSIIGHFERRVNNFDNLHTIKQKTNFAIKNNIVPIYCIGELVDDTKSKKFKG